MPTRWRSRWPPGTACGWTMSGCSRTASRCSRSASTRSRSCSATVDEIIRVDNDEICAAIKDIFDDTRTIAEPAGALALAGLKSLRRDTASVRGQRLAAVLSGANMNFDRLRFVAERAELGEGREALLAVTIPERPGAFRAFCAALGARVVTEFNYRLSGREQAQIFVGVATRSHGEGQELAARLRELGLRNRRPVGQRDGQAPRAPHGRRPRAGRRLGTGVPVRVSRASGRAAAVPRCRGRALEHQPVPLPQSRRGLRPRPGRVRSAGVGLRRHSRRSCRDSTTAFSSTTTTTRITGSSPTTVSADRRSEDVATNQTRSYPMHCAAPSRERATRPVRAAEAATSGLCRESEGRSPSD